MLPAIGYVRPWADPHVVSLHRLDMRPPTVAHASIGAARTGATSPFRRSLDGRWDFRLFDAPESVPATAISRPVDHRWTKVTVPGNWTLQGVGDLPHYTNVRMPFHGPPPKLPERNPTGVHRRTMTIPTRWLGRQIVLHVGGAESVHAVYVNGEFAGYGTDSRLASEYDITALVRAGANDVAIVVMRWSAHSYIEDQDQWWMAGLHREVFVEARSPVHVVSLVCDAGLDGSSGVLNARATIGGLAPPGPGWSVRLHVETLRGKRIGHGMTAGVPHRFATPYVFSGHTATAQLVVPEVAPWSAESPTRHRVVAELFDPSGDLVEVHTQLVGFRNVEVRDRQLLVNDVPIWIFGVNRHDHHPTRGKAVTVDDMRADLLAMRRHNITAVRCSHYPNDPRFLDLCDEIGMYVIDEANIESHAYNTSLCDDDRYRSAWISRGARMVERDRNHPSVILWSLGNESGYGAHHDALAGWIRRTDPSRPLHYEGAVFHAGWVDGGRAASDVVCPMYPTIEAIEAYGRGAAGDRPLIMCEYSHAMGNSNGSLADYWDVITSTPGLQGGFIWEWKDHGLQTRLPNGRRGFAYGGQFGEERHDGNFVADGLMSADLQAHPAMQEVAWVHRPVVVTLDDTSAGDASLRVANRRSFTDLSDLAVTWELLVDGAVVDHGELDVHAVAPGATALLPLPCAIPATGEAFLTVRAAQRRATPWAPAGHLVAWDQLPLPPSSPTPARTPTNPEKSPVRDAERHHRAPFRVEPGAPSEMVRDRDAERNNRGIFRDGDGGGGGPELCVWRAAVDNDGFKLMPELRARSGDGSDALERWKRLGLDRRRADDLVGHRHDVEIADDGTEIHRHEVVVPAELDDLPRIGVTFQLPAAFERLRWFGRGPLENYPDRNRGALLGIWESDVDAPPYLVPQEFGLRTDCRWFEFVDPRAGDVVRLDVLEPGSLHVSATRFTAADLFAAAHETDLRPRRSLVVHADVAHRGLGTASCGPDVLDRYRIAPGTYRFSYQLSRSAAPV